MLNRKCKAVYSSRGSVSIANILSLILIFGLFTAVIWAGRLALEALEIQRDASAVTATVASSGCWTSQSTQVLDNGLAPFQILLPPSAVSVSVSPTTYTGYGGIVTVTLKAAMNFWAGGGTQANKVFTLTGTRTMFSTAPSTNDGIACITPPTHG